MPFHFDVGAQGSNCAVDLAIYEEDQPLEFYCRDRSSKGKRENSAEQQRERRNKAAAPVPPMKRSKDLWPPECSRTCRDVMPHTGTRIALGDRHSVRGHDITLSDGMTIDNGYPIRNSDVARGMTNTSEYIRDIKENIHFIKAVLCVQQNAVAYLGKSSEASDRKVSEMKSEVQTTKEEVSNLKSKLHSLEESFAQGTFESSKKSQFVGGSTKSSAGATDTDLKKKAEEMTSQILKEIQKLQRKADLKDKDITQVKAIDDLEKADAAVGLAIETTETYGGNRNLKPTSKELECDIIALQIVLEYVRMKRKLVENEKERKINHLNRKYDAANMEFCKQLVRKFQETIGVVVSRTEKTKTLGSDPRPPGSSMEEIVEMLPDDTNEIAENFKNISESLAKKDKLITLLKKHCVSLHKIAEESNENDKKVLEVIDSKMAHFSNSLYETRKENERLEKKIHSKSKELHRLNQIIETFSEKLQNYSPCPHAVEKRDVSVETVPNETVSDEKIEDDEEGKGTMEENEVEQPTEEQEDCRPSKKRHLVITLEKDDPEIERRILEMMQLEAGKDIHFARADSLQKLDYSSSEDLIIDPISQFDDRKELHGRKMSKNNYGTLSGITASGSSQEAKIKNSLRDKALNEFSAAAPLSSSSKASREEFFNDTTEEWSPLKLKIKNNDDPKHRIRKQKSAENVSSKKGRIKAIARADNVDLPETSDLVLGEENRRKEHNKKRLAPKLKNIGQVALATQSKYKNAQKKH